MAAHPPPGNLKGEWFGLTFLNVAWQDKMVTGMAQSFIGSFFKRNTSTSNEGELLVFITPRILKSTEAVAARTNPVNGAGK